MTDAPASPAPSPQPRALWHGEVDVGDGIVPITMAGEGPPLIMLHGWTLDRRMWQPQIEALAQDFLLVMPDRRGFGQSSAPPDLMREADDVQRIADFLGFDRYALLGLSQGAVIALDCAHRHGWRTNALLLSGAPLPALVPRDEVLDRDHYAELVRAGDMATMRAEWLAHDLMRLESQEMRPLLDQIIADYDGRDLLVPPRLPGVPRDALAHLPMPVLAMTGMNDTPWRRDCAQAMAQLAPRGRHALIEHAGHMANLDQPEIFSRTVSEFLLKCARNKTSDN